MITCARCGAESRLGQRFCGQCGSALTRVCDACGTENPPDNRFCGSCGSPLVEGAGSAPAPGDTVPVAERRLVSVLFADLVGFTSLSEHRDPEEVRDLLSQYFDRCRSLIERYGGTVEKFIGDAVMAVWGTPVAREDDAERAVRAALALTQAVTALGAEVGMPELRVRAGVLTGNAAVEVGAEGEGMVLGDTVNTASRLQSIAEPATVLVDDVTRRSSEAAIEYEDAGTHQVKGREQPVHAWTALRVVAGVGGARRSAGLEAPFVGREHELQTVIAVADDSVEHRTARLVTVTGDAGTGKSRLLWEFFKYIDGIQDTRWWHQGRCLAYGEGVAYWALAEMVRVRAGITEDDDPELERRKLRETIERFVSDERERRLIEPRLAHLLGLEQRSATEAADLFSGWRLFLERMASANPVILVFEDIQWADSGLLDFVDYLLEWSAEHPIFILALGRPELHPRRRDWGTAIHLDLLAPDAMQALLEGLAPGLGEEVTGRILERAEGVPLYAVETVRMLLDRGLLMQEGTRYVLTGEVSDLEVPETLQALAAARLDNLDTAERKLLQDAAVLGISFFPSAVAAVSQRSDAEVRRILDGLVAKQVLAREDDKRSGEQGQYSFLQGLLRTIALSTLSRRDRKTRHLAAAEHLRTAYGDSTEIAEVLASHYLDAVDAAPEAADADEIRGRARETLHTAGHRAVSLALGGEARRYFERAATLARDEPERAELLAEAGAAAARTADRAGARRLLGDAITALDAAGRAEDAARTRIRLATVLVYDNRLEQARDLLDEAERSASDEPTRAELAARRAQVAFLTDDYRGARDQAELALSIADPRNLVVVVAEAAMTKAVALNYEDRMTEGMAMMELGLRVALEEGITDQALRGYYNLSDSRLLTGRTREAAELLERGLALARERGDRTWERDLLAQTIQGHVFCGRWDQAIAQAEALREGGDDEASRVSVAPLAVIFSSRGDVAALEPLTAPPAAPSEWSELATMEAAGRAIALRALGRHDECEEVALQVAAELPHVNNSTKAIFVDDVIDILLQSGQLEPLEDLIPPTHLRVMAGARGQLERGRAQLQRLRGDVAAAELTLVEAVKALRTAEAPFNLARGLLDHGRLLTELGRSAQADALLHEARTIFTALGATPWVARSDALLSPDPAPAAR